MAVKLMWAYVKSELTPWKETIDGNMICNYVSLSSGRYFSDVCSFGALNEDLASYLKHSDYVVNLCYGLGGLDQVDIARWFDGHDIRHTAPMINALSLCQDKSMVGSIAKACGAISPMALPLNTNSPKKLICKPRFGARHRGIFVGNAAEIHTQLSDVNEEYIIQEFVVGKEFTVSVIPDFDGSGIEPLEPMEIYSDTHGANFFMGQKGVNTERDYFPKLDKSVCIKMKEVALNVHIATGCHGISRCEFRVNEGHVYLLEVNAMPNLHPRLSLLPRIAEENGITNQELIRRILKYYTTQDKCHPSIIQT